MFDSKKILLGEVSYGEIVAIAHALDPALIFLEVVAHKPIQGEAMHKVIAYHAAKALQFADYGKNNERLYRIVDPNDK